jgi:hypothetical protein
MNERDPAHVVGQRREPPREDPPEGTVGEVGPPRTPRGDDEGHGRRHPGQEHPTNAVRHREEAVEVAEKAGDRAGAGQERDDQPRVLRDRERAEKPGPRRHPHHPLR